VSDAHILEGTRSFTDTKRSPREPSALTRPANGWTDARLGRVFGDPFAEKAKLSGGAIAGIVVGSIAALALLAVGCWYAWRCWYTGAKVVPQNNAGQLNEWQAPDRGDSQSMREQTKITVVAT
jgi:hypothetical protein